ncbi:MAG TPA: class I SAM-dependent methyltransferase, partial [Longimicrobium sp.]|nr:class I SAM-dependent methyltransferase [Longimicrobium sp.]
MGTELLTEAERETKQAGAEFWDANPCGGAWKSYREFLDWYRATEPYIYEILDRYDWRGVEAVEVGCGQGTLVNHLAPKGALVTGIDMSLGSIARAMAGARELGHADRVRLLRADAERLPFADASFDAALSGGVLHHTPDIRAGIAEIHRVLRPGGTLVLAETVEDNPLLRIGRKVHDSWDGVGIHGHFTARSLLQEVGAAGLQVVDQRQHSLLSFAAWALPAGIDRRAWHALYGVEAR